VEFAGCGFLQYRYSSTVLYSARLGALSFFFFLVAFASCRSSATKAVDEKACKTSLAALFIGSVAYEYDTVQ